MKLRSIKYFFEEGFKGVFRNRLMSITSMLTVSACIFILVFSYCVAANIDYILEQFENSFGVSVIIKDDIPTEEVDLLYNKVVSIEGVESVEYISADMALKIFAERVGDEEGIISGFENDNPMPRSFTVTIKDAKSQDRVISELESMADIGVDKVIHAKKTISSLTAVNNVIRIVSIVIVLILGLLSVVIIMNTIKLTVNNRKTDIGIMKYIGATNWFIKWPFVIEGIIIGVVGAVIPVIIVNIGYNNLINIISTEISALSKLIVFKPGYEIFAVLTPAMLILGIFIGALGSTLSMRKYLDV